VYGNAWVSGNLDLIVIHNIGSRNSSLTICKQKDGSLMYATGCFYGNEDSFVKSVNNTHKDNVHGKTYMAAIAMAKIMMTPKSAA